MTPLTKPCRRVTRGALDWHFGKDSGRRLVAELAPGDLLTLRPLGTRRPETVSLFDVHAWAIRCRVNHALLEKARAAKATKARRQKPGDELPRRPNIFPESAQMKPATVAPRPADATAALGRHN
jgi:hypothetical protein